MEGDQAMTDATLHLVPNAGDPQEHPGPECQGWSRPLPDPDRAHWSAFRRLVHMARPTAICAGCFGRHPAERKATFGYVGLMIPAHTPSPPQHHECSVCYGPMVPPSYTPAPHRGCTPGEADTDGYGDE
jgi:hypothetical protein